MGKKRTHSQIIQKRKDNPKEWSIKKKIIIFYTVLMVFYGIYTMVLGIVAVAKFSGVIDSYKRMVDNLDNDIIVDVKAGQEGKCSSGYESIFNYEWGGMQTGCDCNNAPNTSKYSDVSKQLYAGSCNGNQTDAGCSKVSSVSGKDFYLWELNDAAQNICVKREKNTPFYKNAPKKAECSSGEKKCGHSSEPNSIYCVKDSDDCPIYEFTFDTQANVLKGELGYEEIQLLQEGNPTSPLSLYINRYGKNQPISQIRVTEGKGVCHENDKPNMTKGRSKYILDETPKEYCSDVDERFEKITNDLQVGEIDYFTINGKYNNIKNLSEIKLSNDYKYNTFTRTFLEWDVEYREDLEKLVNLEDKIDKMSTSQTIIMVVNILVCLFVSIILTIAQVYNLCGKDVPCIAGDGEKEQQRIKYIKKILQYGAKFLQFPFIIWAFTAAYQNKDFIRSVADNEPSDEQTNKEFNNLANEIETSVFNADLQMLVAFIAVCVVDLGLYGYKLYKKKNKKKNQVQQINPEYKEQGQEESEVPVKQEQEVTPQQNQQQQITQSNLPPQQYQQPQQQYVQQPPQDPNQQQPMQPPPMPEYQTPPPPPPMPMDEEQQVQQPPE